MTPLPVRRSIAALMASAVLIAGCQGGVTPLTPATGGLTTVSKNSAEKFAPRRMDGGAYMMEFDTLSGAQSAAETEAALSGYDGGVTLVSTDELGHPGEEGYPWWWGPLYVYETSKYYWAIGTTEATPEPTPVPTPTPDQDLTIQVGETFSPNADDSQDSVQIDVTADPNRGSWTLTIDSPTDGPRVVRQGTGDASFYWSGIVDENTEYQADVLSGTFEFALRYDNNSVGPTRSTIAAGLTRIGPDFASAYRILESNGPRIPVRYISRPPSLKGRVLHISPTKIVRDAKLPSRKGSQESKALSALRSHSNPDKTAPFGKEGQYKLFPVVKGKPAEMEQLAQNLVELILLSPYNRYVLAAGSHYVARYGTECLQVFAKVPVSNPWVNRNVELGILVTRDNRFITFLASPLEVIP